MKKIVIFIALLFCLTSLLGAKLPVGFTFIKDGVLTAPDSARIDVILLPSETDTTFALAPDSAIWDTLINITTNDTKATIKYTLFSGGDTAFARETYELQYDSSLFLSSFWREIADNSDSGSIANVGVYVWTYGTRELTALSGITLSPAERQAIADSARAEMERSSGFLWNLLNFWGACDSCYTVYFPDDGTSPKDSAVVYNNAGVAQMTIKYSHSNNNAVADTSKVFDR